MEVPAKGSPRRTDWPLLLLSVLVVLSLVGFGVYYYIDRYYRPSDTLVDRQAQHFEELVKKNPQNADLRAGVASYYFDAGRTAEAVEQAKEALKINADHQAALTLLGRIYTKTGDLDAAITSYNRVVELNKDNPMADIDPRMEAIYYQLGTLYGQQGKSAEAIEAFKHALIIDDTDADAHYSLGSLYQKQNDHAGAVKEFEGALRFVPDFAEAYQGLEASYTALGKTKEASYAQGMVAFSQGKYADAASKLQALVDQSPDYTQAYFGLGLANEKLGKKEVALAALQKYVQANPGDVAAQQAIGRLNGK